MTTGHVISEDESLAISCSMSEVKITTSGPADPLSPILRLPPELFLAIVRQILRFRKVVGNGNSFEDLYGYHLLVASVCRSWRDIILGASSLWAIITGACLHFTPRLLKRSGSAPLSLYLECIPDAYSAELVDEMLELIWSQHSRIKDLNLDVKLLRDTSPSVLWNPVPSLTRCNLTSTGINPNSHHALFDGVFPHLIDLTLRDMGFSWDMPLLCSIPSCQRLFIYFPKNRPMLHQLLTVLRCMPNLEVLSLYKTLRAPSHEPVTPSESSTSNHQPLGRLDTNVALSNLKDLTIMGRSDEVISFLNSTSLEQLENRNVTMTIMCEDDIQDTPHLQASFHSWFTNLGKQAVQHEYEGRDTIFLHSLTMTKLFGFYPRYLFADFHSWDSPRAYKTGRTEHDSQIPCTVTSTSRLKIHLEWTPRRNVDGQFEFPKCTVLHILSLSHCKKFTVGHRLTMEEWSLCSTILGSVEELELYGILVMRSGTFVDLLQVLDAIDDSMESVSFPNLKSLKVEYKCGVEIMDRLCTVLRNRSRVGCRMLERLAIGLEHVGEQTRVLEEHIRGLVDGFVILNLAKLERGRYMMQVLRD
ncbi:hypothetical protein AX16_008730 [Volvariella volvacea WC 439]|nr:hypothetical protein AX16_008730 [Volvariella volvacea WC 439]